jgi:hypothetical protein
VELPILFIRYLLYRHLLPYPIDGAEVPSYHTNHFRRKEAMERLSPSKSMPQER